MIVQFEGAKRNLTLIFGKHTGNDDGDETFVSNTSGDFDPAPVDDDELEDDTESELFVFRPQRRTFADLLDAFPLSPSCPRGADDSFDRKAANRLVAAWRTGRYGAEHADH